jgi:DUF917 family protein
MAKPKVQPSKFALTIDLGNAAMDSRSDIAAALTKVAKQITNVAMSKGIVVKIMDENGNSVGSWSYA